MKRQFLLLAIVIGARAQEFPVDTRNQSTQGPKVATLPDGAKVTFKITKRPNETCKVEWKSEVLPKEASGAAGFLSALVKGAAVAGAGRDCRAIKVPVAPAAVTNGAALATRLDIAATTLSVLAEEAAHQSEIYRAAAENASKLTTCADPAKPDKPLEKCACVEDYKTAKDDVERELDGVVNSPVPSVAGLEQQLKELAEFTKKLPESPIPPEQAVAFATWLAAVQEKVACLAEGMEGSRRQIASLVEKKTQADQLLKKFQDMTILLQETKTLPPFHNRKVDGTVTCTNYFTGLELFPAAPFNLEFRGVPRVTASAGVLIQAQRNRRVGVTPEPDTAAIGFKLKVAELDASTWQPIPFSFVHVRLKKLKDYGPPPTSFWSLAVPTTFNVTGGVGVNPRYGSNQAEFFYGTSLGFGNLFVHAGVHLMRWQDAQAPYNLGDTVPAEKFPGLAVTRRYVNKFGFGISYRLPLP